MAGPKPKKRGPKSGDNVGGVCPEEVLFAVRRASSESSLTTIIWRGGGNGGRKHVAKWVGGYPRAKKNGSREELVAEQ